MISVITITGIGDHLQPEWLITFTGIRTGNMRMGLYADSAGEPGALIATTEAKAFTATGSGHWEELTFTSPPTTVGGVKYWLACHTDVSVNSRGSDGATRTTLAPDHSVLRQRPA